MQSYFNTELDLNYLSHSIFHLTNIYLNVNIISYYKGIYTTLMDYQVLSSLCKFGFIIDHLPPPSPTSLLQHNSLQEKPSINIVHQLEETCLSLLYSCQQRTQYLYNICVNNLIWILMYLYI